jgi:hypothetical protein
MDVFPYPLPGASFNCTQILVTYGLCAQAAPVQLVQGVWLLYSCFVADHGTRTPQTVTNPLMPISGQSSSSGKQQKDAIVEASLRASFLDTAHGVLDNQPIMAAQ